MTKKKVTQATRRKTTLRRRAESVITKRGKAAPDRTSRLLHELEIHQVELELQNEELRLARETTELALQRYTEVFDFAPIGYVTLDRNGIIKEMNHAGARLLGAERRRFIGKRFASFVAGPSLQCLDGLLRSRLARSSSAGAEIELRRNGVSTPVRVTASILRNDDPTFLVAFEDISEQRRKESELARSEHALRDLVRRRDDFLAMLSHELRNPLSPIRMSVAVLQLAPAGSDAAHNAISLIDRSTAHLTRLIDDLLDITRITRGKLALKREHVDLVALLESTVEDLRSGFEERQIAVTVQCCREPLWIHCDAARVVQALTNVLGNAEKFTPAGGSVTITLEHVDRRAIIKIADTGVGIAPEVIGGLFEPFAQAPQALDRSRGGLGLGLAMVKSLVELHGGRVAIRSEGIGRGTEIIIVLAAEQAAPRERDRNKMYRPMHRRRILIIEDQRDCAHSLQEALLLRGHEVQVAYDGAAGLELIASFEPDVVLCDLGLPDLDGFELAMRVRADTLRRGTCLVALSGYARPEDAVRAKAAGFDRHLAKPPNLDELDDVLASVPSRYFDNPPTSNTLH